MKTCTDTTSGGRRKGQRGITLMELLIAMTIMTLITTMIIVSWLALSDSYSYSVRSSVARDDAREAIARMAREIRDAQSNPNGGEAALLRARPRSILITTTFNEAGNTDPASVPHLVMFRLYPDGELWRFEDRPVGGVYDGVIDNVALSIADTWPGANPYGAVESVEQTTGEGASLLCKDVGQRHRDFPRGPQGAVPVQLLRAGRGSGAGHARHDDHQPLAGRGRPGQPPG